MCLQAMNLNNRFAPSLFYSKRSTYQSSVSLSLVLIHIYITPAVKFYSIAFCKLADGEVYNQLSHGYVIICEQSLQWYV